MERGTTTRESAEQRPVTARPAWAQRGAPANDGVVEQRARRDASNVIARLSAAPGSGRTIRRLTAWASESTHYRNSRDESHAEAKTALLAADSQNAITQKLYNAQKGKAPTGKMVTSFKTTSNRFLVVVSYVNVASGKVTYDTAYLSDKVALGGGGGVMYNPESPVITA